MRTDNRDDVSYRLGNYKHQAEGGKVSVLPKEQLEWLKKDLASAKYPAITFSHHSLIESRSGITNPQEFRDAIKDSPNGVLMSICGDEHLDRLEQKDGVYYLCINSMTYYWAGSNYDHTTYGKDVEAAYPMLRKIFPYRDPLFAIIDITDDRIYIKGTETDIVGASPKDLGFTKKGLVNKITSEIEDKTIKIKTE